VSDVALVNIQQTINVPAGAIIDIGFSFAVPGPSDGTDSPAFIMLSLEGHPQIFREPLTTFQNGNPGGWESAVLTDYIVQNNNPELQIQLSGGDSVTNTELEIGIDNVWVTIVQNADYGQNPCFTTASPSTCHQNLLGNGGFNSNLNSFFPWIVSTTSTTGNALVKAGFDEISAPEEGAYLVLMDDTLQTWTVQQQITLPSATAINCGYFLNLESNPVQSSIQMKINGALCGESVGLYDTSLLGPGGWFSQSGFMTTTAANPTIEIKLTFPSDGSMLQWQVGLDAIYITIDDGSGLPPCNF
jgi:hypothetical protein